MHMSSKSDIRSDVRFAIQCTRLLTHLALDAAFMAAVQASVRTAHALKTYENNYIMTDYSYRTLERDAEDLFGPMREATQEEQKSVEDYIESISVNTGVKFF